MKKFYRRGDLYFLGIMVLLPMIFTQSQHLLVLAGLYGMCSLGLSLFMGYAGQISLGHAAFFGIGAYTTAILTTRFGFPTPVALFASVATAALIGFIIGKPILKLKEYFLALATMGFVEIFQVVATETRGLTGGVIGIFGIPWFSVGGFQFDTPLRQYYLTWGLLFGLLLYSRNVVRSRIGRALLAVASSDDLASTVGIDPSEFKLKAFILSAAYAGMAGALFACMISTANPGTFGLNLSILIVMMVIVGGTGSLYGSIFGALVLTWVTDYLGKYQEYSMPIFGIVLILILIVAPQGILRGTPVRLIKVMRRIFAPKGWKREIEL